MDGAERRLAAHAARASVSAPKPLLSDDGAPSKEVIDYCDKHSLTLDWVFLGSEPKFRQSKATTQEANTVAKKGESKLSEHSFYSVKRETDHIDRLYSIIHLSMLGAAATETAHDIEHLLDAHVTMYETIHALACEGVEIAEMEQKKLNVLDGDVVSAVPEKAA